MALSRGLEARTTLAPTKINIFRYRASTNHDVGFEGGFGWGDNLSIFQISPASSIWNITRHLGSPSCRAPTLQMIGLDVHVNTSTLNWPYSISDQARTTEPLLLSFFLYKGTNYAIDSTPLSPLCLAVYLHPLIMTTPSLNLSAVSGSFPFQSKSIPLSQNQKITLGSEVMETDTGERRTAAMTNGWFAAKHPIRITGIGGGSAPPAVSPLPLSSRHSEIWWDGQQVSPLHSNLKTND